MSRWNPKKFPYSTVNPWVCLRPTHHWEAPLELRASLWCTVFCEVKADAFSCNINCCAAERWLPHWHSSLFPVKARVHSRSYKCIIQIARSILFQLPPLINRATSNGAIESAEHVDGHEHSCSYRQQIFLPIERHKSHNTQGKKIRGNRRDKHNIPSAKYGT
jgi:hypothetical protein